MAYQYPELKQYKAFDAKTNQQKFMCIHNLRAEIDKGLNAVQIETNLKTIAGVREQIITGNLRLAPAISKKISGDKERIISSGYLGLIKAVDSFNPVRVSKSGKTASFATYACVTMYHVMLADLANSHRILPSAALGNKIIYERMMGHLYNQGINTPTDDQMVDTLSKILPPSDVRRHKPQSMLGTLLRASTLTEMPEFDLMTIPCNDDMIIDGIDNVSKLELVRQAMTKLDDKELTILDRYYGLNGCREETLKDIGDSFGCTRERIRQIKFKTLNRLKELVNDGL